MSRARTKPRPGIVTHGLCFIFSRDRQDSAVGSGAACMRARFALVKSASTLSETHIAHQAVVDGCSMKFNSTRERFVEGEGYFGW